MTPTQVFATGILAFSFQAILHGQSHPESMAFEVASVKPSGPGAGGVHGGCHGINSVYTPGQTLAAPPLGRCVIADGRLSHLISIAWKMQTMDMIKSGPEWIARGVERYNIEAKAEDPRKATEQQLLEMLQGLLIERFQLKFHREPAELPGFALKVAKNGPKLKKSTRPDEDFSFPGQGKPARGQPTTFIAHGMSIRSLVDLLSSFGGHGPGIDQTGLEGAYDIELKWDDDSGPTLDVALREQLGLQMESQKVPVSYFVVDSAQKPSAN
jgi:uncharacterized protein (TIGR03435 family)